MARLSFEAFPRALDANGDPASGAKLYVYTAGTTSPVTTYSDEALTTPQAHPVVADSAGYFPQVYVTSGKYKIVVTTAADVTIDEADDVNQGGFGYKTAATLKASSEGPRGTGAIWQAGDYRYEEAASDATDHDVVTAGSVKLYVLPTRGEIWDEQFFDITNDADRVNAAIAKAIALNKLGTAYKVMVVGQYTMDKPIRVFDLNDAGTDFNYLSVTVEAPASGYLNNQRTTFKFTDKEAPGVVIHNARDVVFRNISIIGSANNLALPSYSDLLNRNNWWNVNGARSTQFSPHAGVTIDHLDSTIATDRYPSLDGFYLDGPGNAGSTQILFESCEVQGWVVGRLDAGSNIQLGDSIVFRDCNMSYNGVIWCPAESQNRGCAMIECHAKGFDCLVSTNRFGVGNGNLNRVIGGVYVYGHHLVEGNTDRGDGSLSGVYAESIWAIGHVTGSGGGQGLTISNCILKLIDASNQNLPSVDLHLSGDSFVTFVGGYVGKYNNFPRRLNLRGRTNVFGTVFDEVPFVENRDNHHWSQMGLRYSGNGPMRQQVIGTLGASLNNPKSSLGTVFYSGDEVWNAAGEWQLIFSGSGTVTIGANGTASVSGLDHTTIQVGDEIGILGPWTGKENDGSGTSTSIRSVGIGLVDSIGANVELTGVPVSLVNGTYDFYTYEAPLVRKVSFGDTTNGSTSVANVTEAGSWRVGDPIRGSGIPNYARVTAKSGTTLTISKAATATKTGVEIYGAKLILTHKLGINAPTSGTFPAGSFVTNSSPSKDANNMVLVGWRCTAGGSPGTWEPQYISAVTPAV